MSNWDKANKIYQKIKVYDEQIKNLTNLAEQINEDNASIELIVEHENEKFRHRHNQPPPMMLMMGGQENYKNPNPPDFDPCYIKLHDQYAMHMISTIIDGLKQQREMLQEMLDNAQEEILIKRIKEN